MFKKILIVLVFFSVLFPLTTSAQSIADLERQIRELTQQIERLRNQSGTGTTRWCYTFNTNLGVGAKGDEVRNLQQALSNEGFNTDWMSSNVYDETIAATVSRFQEKNREEILTASGLSAPTGYFGPASRKKMNSLYGCGVGIKPPISSRSSITLKFNTGGDNFVAALSLTNDSGLLVRPVSTYGFAPYFSLSPGYYNATLDTKEYRNNQSISTENHRITARLKVSGSAAGGSVYSVEGSTINIDGKSNTDLLKLVINAFVRSNYVDIVASSGDDYANVKFTLIDGQGRVVNTANSILPVYKLPVGHYIAGISINGNNNNHEEIKLSVEANSSGYIINYNEKQPIPMPYPIPTPDPYPQSLTVVSPNGGEAWQKGTNQLIQWSWDTNAFAGQQFTIYLNPASVNCQEGQPCVTPQWKIAAGISGTNWYDWNVGKTTTDAPPAGAYYVQICSPNNNYGGQVCDQSDSYFKIYDSTNTGNQPPVIHSTEGPTALKVGETGTWSVRASDPENGQLSYSVIWGDEATTGTTASSPTMEKAQQTATFTHSYAYAGTYYPKFKVTDNAGQSNSASLSVVVGSVPTVNQSPKIVVPSGNPIVSVGETVNVALIASDPDGDKLSLGVDWGDNTGSATACLSYLSYPYPHNDQLFGNQELKASHVYSAAKTYDVTARIIDCRGGEAKQSLNVEVKPLVASTLQVLSPNGGESWPKGSTQTISWGATGAPEVSVYLVRDSDPTYRLAIRHNFVSGRANSIEWAVPSGDTESGSHIAAGSDYRIWVIGGGTTAVDDKSDQPFNIVEQ